MNLGLAVAGAKGRLEGAARSQGRPLLPLTLKPGVGYPLGLGVDVSISSVDRGLRRGRVPRRAASRRGMAAMDPKKFTAWRQIGLLSSIPFILALAPIVGYFLGKYLDQKFRTQPWLSIALLALGFVAGVRETIKIIKMSQQED
jgi:ATP synthase protein I